MAGIPALKPGIVYIDPSVGSSEFKSLLNKLGLKAQLMPLPYSTGNEKADFAFLTADDFLGKSVASRVVVERKTLSDMQGSLLKDRFRKQVVGMLTDYDVAWLIVEGIWRAGADDSIEIPRRGGWEAAFSALTYSQLSSWLTRYDVYGSGKIRRWRTGSKQETAAWLAATYRWCVKPWKHHQVESMAKMQKPHSSLIFRATELMDNALSLRGIGGKSAKRVGRHFASIHQMINANEADWRAAGLGKKAAATVWTAIRKRYR